MTDFQGKKVLIVGLGLSGVAVARFMSQQQAIITVVEAKTAQACAQFVQQCEGLAVQFEFGPHQREFFLAADVIVVSPGVPWENPLLQEAKLAQKILLSEAELAISLIREPIVAVTGTNGKTTTTTLIGEMAKAAGKKVFVGGNIGTPLLDYVLSASKVDWVVAELSSFQLEVLPSLKPRVAVLTNLEPDHLDRYGSFAAYQAAKKNLLIACLSDQATVILNEEDPILRAWGEAHEGKVVWWSKRDKGSAATAETRPYQGAYLAPSKKPGKPAAKEMVTHFGDETVHFDLTPFKLLGSHNRENLMAAACAATVMGLPAACIRKVIAEFKGVPHRLEFVRKKDGVFFFNDSKGTNVMSVQKSLAAFASSPVILIAGGKDKDSDFTPLVELVKQKCKILVLYGEAKEKINRTLGDLTETYLVGSFEEAVLLSYQKSRSGDIVLLSPACASFDLFRNFEERGHYFRKLVEQL